MATTVEISGSERLKAGDKVKIFAYNTAYPNSTFTIEMRRRLASASKDADNDVLLESREVTSDDGGFISVDWSPPSSALTGELFKYYPCVYVGTQGYYSTTAGVPASNYDLMILDKSELLIDDLSVALGPAQAIPVYTEVSKDSGVYPSATTGRYTYDFTWDNWNSRFETVVYTLSQDEEVYKQENIDYTVDYRDGKVTFGSLVGGYMDVEASYVFKYFSNMDLLKFCEQALAMMNFIAPYTSFTLYSYPDYWRSAIVAGGVTIALEQLFQAPLYRERRLIFSDADIVSTLGSYYDRVRQSFTEAQSKKARPSLVAPIGISGHDIIAPPRVTAQSYQSWAYLRGRGI